MDSRLLRLLGTFPVRPSSYRYAVLEQQECRRYTRSLVAYDVQDGERVPAYLLWPKSTRLSVDSRLPAALALHQHAGHYDVGKSESAGLLAGPNHTAYGHELAERGWVVLVPDQLGFEDRRPPERERKNNHDINDGGYERFVYFEALLHGSTLQAKYLHDSACAIDVLTRLEGVDPSRVGSIGHSLGGQQTLWLMMYDDRIRFGVASCGISTYASILADKITHNMPFYVPGVLRLGDMDSLLLDVVPRGLFISSGAADRIFPIRGVREIDAALSAAYARQNRSDRYTFLAVPGGHDFPPSVRWEAYAWLERRLGDPDPIEST